MKLPKKPNGNRNGSPAPRSVAIASFGRLAETRTRNASEAGETRTAEEGPSASGTAETQNEE